MMRFFSTLTMLTLYLCTMKNGAAQNCNDVVNITAITREVFVNRSISRTCIQCVDDSMTILSTATWIINNREIQLVISPSENPIPSEVELENGVLVLLNPMDLITDGASNRYTLQCVGVTKSGQSVAVYSSALIPPVISPSSNLTVTEGGDRIIITCHNNNIVPSLRNGLLQLIYPNGSVGGISVVITSIRREQAGDYHCRITSSGGDVLLSTVLTITVQYGANVTSEDSHLVQLHPTNNIVLSCVFTGVPLPTVTWYHNGSPHQHGRDGVTITTTNNSSELTVVRSGGQREGVYTCTATNTLGTSSLEFTVEFFPETVLGLTNTSLSETSVTLNWMYQYSESTSTRLRVEIEIRRIGENQPTDGKSGPNETTVVISSLSPLTSYNITVYVVNGVGRSEPSTIQVATLSHKLSQPTISVFIPLSSSELFLQWQHPPLMTDTTHPPIGWDIQLSLTTTGQTVHRMTRYDPHLYNTTFTDLNPGTEYRVRVAGVNTRGSGTFSEYANAQTNGSVTTQTNSTLSREAGGSSGSGVVVVVIVVILVIILLILAIAILLYIYIRKRWYLGRKYEWKEVFRREQADGNVVTETVFNGESGKREDMINGGRETTDQHNSDDAKEDSNIPLTNTDGIGDEKCIAPQIVDYQHEVVACEGEQVTLRVVSSGTPRPTLTWTLEGNKVEADYAIEIESDGSLFFVCTEKKHAGRYGFQLSSRAGCVGGEMNLVVKEEGAKEEEEANSLESNPIKLDDFGEYVCEMHANNNTGFLLQFQKLSTGEENETTEVGKTVQNKPLNRFKNILPYDGHQLQLVPIEDCTDCQNQYINASHIEFLQPKTYIACQGPLPHTIVNFWQLVWQEEVNTISMLTNIMENKRKKCERYWPEVSSEKYGPFKITLAQTQTFADYVIRTFLLECTLEKTKPRTIRHYHFTSWPDHGAPEYASPLLNYLKRVKSHNKGTLLIHCSAGVGRTGTLIGIDMAITQAPTDGVVDIPSIVTKLRRQRMKMVQTADQYKFIHDAVLESLSCGDTQIAAADLCSAIQRLKEKDEQTGRTGYETQYQVLEQVSPKDNEVIRATANSYKNKNRNSKYLPPDKWRCCLRNEIPDYIHASFVDGYKQKKGFIIGQAPMENTVRDFWKLVSERECGVVVMLSGLKEEGEEMCSQYWPTEGDSTEYGQYLVTTVKVHKNEGYTQRVFTVTNPKSPKLHKVTQFQLEEWSPGGLCGNPAALIAVVDHMTVVQRKTGNKPILVHGKDTVSRVGVFCSLVNAIELCKTEGIVDVFQVVKALRIQKPASVQTVEQYSFVFDMVLLFLDSFSVYANFK